VYNSSGVFLGHVMDGINSLEDEDINIKPHPFNPKLKLNHSTFRLELNRNYMELQSPSVVRIDQKRFIVPSKMYNPDTHYGGMFNTTNSPQPLFIDRLVPMVPGQLNYKFSPGFSHFTPGETIRLTTFTTDKSYHPNDGFNPNTMRNYLMFSNVTHIFSDYNEWTKSGTWDPQTNGNSYNGIPNYINSNVAGSYVQVTKNLNYYSGSDGYDFYLLARNLNNSDSSFKFYIDGVDKGTVNFVYANSGNNCCGIYLGDLVPTTPSHTFKIQVVSGNIGLFYILMVPQFDWSFGTPLNDLKQSYNIN
jgi:hypothetical protein